MEARQRQNRIRWQAIGAVTAALAVLSAAQIYLRQRAAGEDPSWAWTLATNLLAWLPWIPIAVAVLYLSRRFPLAGDRRWRHLALHLGAAVVTAVAYLAYLALFWLAAFPERMASLGAATLGGALGRALGEHFLVAFVAYWFILATGLGAGAFDRHRNQAADTERKPAQRLKVRSLGRVRYVDVEDIDWIEADGSYVRLHLGDASVLLRRTLSGLADELAGAGFARIHRSAVVSLERIVELRPLSHGEASLRLRDGRQLKVSRNYRKPLEALLR